MKSKKRRNCTSAAFSTQVAGNPISHALSVQDKTNQNYFPHKVRNLAFKIEEETFNWYSWLKKGIFIDKLFQEWSLHSF